MNEEEITSSSYRQQAEGCNENEQNRPKDEWFQKLKLTATSILVAMIREQGDG